MLKVIHWFLLLLLLYPTLLNYNNRYHTQLPESEEWIRCTPLCCRTCYNPVSLLYHLLYNRYCLFMDWSLTLDTTFFELLNIIQRYGCYCIVKISVYFHLHSLAKLSVFVFEFNASLRKFKLYITSNSQAHHKEMKTHITCL